MHAKLRLPPQNRSLSSCSSLQTATLTGSDDRIEPNYFQHKHVDFLAETNFVFFDFLSSPGFPRIPRPLPDQKNRENIKNIDFYEKSENRNFSGNRNFRVGGTRPLCPPWAPGPGSISPGTPRSRVHKSRDPRSRVHKPRVHESRDPGTP